MSRYIDADKIEYEPMCRARGNGMYEDCEVTYKDRIDDIPAADVRENVKGKWVYEDEYYQDDGTHVVVGYPHCSVCNYEPYYPDDERIDECTPFCPNCGADMRGEA